MLSESARSFTRTLQYVEKPAVLLDLDYRLTFANAPLLSYTGCSMEQLLGQDFFDALIRNPGFAKRTFKDEANACDTNSFELRLELRTAKGGYEEKLFNVTLCKDDNGAVANYALVETAG